MGMFGNNCRIQGRFVFFLLFSIFFFIVPHYVDAQEGHIKLLAVTEKSDGTLEGTTADLYLEIKSGDGRVFIETYPLTKIDTQISTRFANDIACNYLEVDCSNLDFFYTINADSPIIGGPSAGAAISLLTSSLLIGLKYDENVSITGTINSGEIIGPVGGLKEKVQAAKKAGLKKVIIPIGDSIHIGNSTMTIEAFAKNLSIEIIPVPTLDDAMFEFTGRKKNYQKSDILIPKEYAETMKTLAEGLCQRAESTLTEINNNASIQLKMSSDFLSSMLNAENLTKKGEAAFKEESYYSAASYYFGASVQYKDLLFQSINMSNEEQFKEAETTLAQLNEFEKRIERKTLRTITDLQAYMIVKERTYEARNNLNETFRKLNKNSSGTYSLAFGIERLYSAGLWANFFGKGDEKFVLDKEVLKTSCFSKINEAQERYHYSIAHLPGTLGNTLKGIQKARSYYESGDYPLCIFKASKAKAEADLILSMLTIDYSRLDNLIDQKLDVVETVIGKESENGIFPIVGYSYYEYAKNLRSSDKYSSLLYAEYSLELSNFDIYFKKDYNPSFSFNLEKQTFIIFFIGFLTGVLFILALFFPFNTRIKPGKHLPKEMLAGKKR